MKYYLKSLVVIGIYIIPFGVVSCNNESSTDTKTNDSTSVMDKKTDTMSTAMNEKDQAFLTDMVGGNYAEIKLTQLAQQKSKDAEIKDVAKFLETDHTNALNDLKDLAGKKNVNAPSEEPQDAKDKIKGKNFFK